ncbi:MAG TPA: hypothetical protein VK789_24855 [Bryobacteraceae bacterium]|nr:hypothetical protein [Bryobacteraceae bacterium]
MKIIFLLSAIGLFAPVRAQWTVETPGIRRTKDGKPNLSAPVPRTSEGEPDLSGIWEQLNARDSAYYLKGISFPFTPSGKALFEGRKANNQRTTPKRSVFRGLPKAEAFDIHKMFRFPDWF